MSDLGSRLRDYFAPRTLLKLAPLWALAGGTSIVLGAALRDPQWTQTGLGALLTSVGANIASSMLYDVAKPELDDDSREALIARGLEQRDPGVIRLVAEALAAAGPELAQALPDATREQLVALLGRGMQDSGGVLAEIAPRYTAALRNPPTNWAALQADLHQTIQKVTQTMVATDGGVVSGSQQHTENVSGPVTQVITARGKGSRIENSSQTSIGGTSDERRAEASRPAPNPLSEREHRQRMLNQYTRRLQELEQRFAVQGIETPPHVIIEIEEIQAALQRLREEPGG